LNFVYCLAGKGKRFTDKNITIPKYLLELEDRQTILEKSVLEFNFSPQMNLLLVINQEHKGFTGQIEKILSKLHGNVKVIVTPDTRGQAETALIGCNCIDNDHPVFFFNGDTILKNRDVGSMANDLAQQYKGAIDVFLEDRAHFSFVELSDQNIVVKIAEKEAISRYATTGLYGFSDKGLFTDYYNQIDTSKEMYISDIYKLMIASNEKIRAYLCPDENDTIILGTPEEYFSNKGKL
jgi:dTDP-glucose pyrophosphorylase